MRKIKNKKAVSPVVASLLLVVIVIVLAMIIFIWAKSFIKEVIQKRGTSASQVCQEIKLQATYSPSTGEVSISNIGNYPIYAIQLRLKLGGETSIISSDKSFPLGVGDIISDNKLISSSDAEVEVIPIIQGTTSRGKKTKYTCQDNTFLAEAI